MEGIKITRDAQLVKVIAAQARHEKVESDKAEEAAQIIMDLTADLNPQNRYAIGQLVGFTVNELQAQELPWLTSMADVKNVQPNDKAAFKIRMEGIRAFIQAKGATTSRSKIADKQVTLSTIAVSARPFLNIMELRSGSKMMADLIREANREITNTKLSYIQSVLAAGLDDYSTPFYASGAGVVAATIDPIIVHWRRYGNVTILGDIAAVSKLAALTGFVSTGTTYQFSPNMIDEYNKNGYVGTYKGANVVVMPNAYTSDNVTPLIDPAWLYIMPVATSPDMRNLKVVNEGAVMATDATNIDDQTYEVRLDQWFGAGFVVGTTPTISAYNDSTL